MRLKPYLGSEMGPRTGLSPHSEPVLGLFVSRSSHSTCCGTPATAADQGRQNRSTCAGGGVSASLQHPPGPHRAEPVSCISLLGRVTFPKACTSDMADISALLGSISGIANLCKRPPRSPLSGRFAPRLKYTRTDELICMARRVGVELSKEGFRMTVQEYLHL